MYIHSQCNPTTNKFRDQYLGGTLRATPAETFLSLNTKLGGARLRATFTTENPPVGLDLYRFEIIETQLFQYMEGPKKVASEAKGKWVRFDFDVGWLFWMRVGNGRFGLQLSPGTRTTFAETLRHLRPGTAQVSIELADAPESGSARGRVFLWLVKNLAGIVATEKQYNVDRRAVAGAIAWEALQNACIGMGADIATSSGAAMFSGPGKVHYKQFRTEEGNPASKVVEQRGRLPVQTMEGRWKTLKTTPGALTYIGTIMKEFTDAARSGGYHLECDVPMLTTFYNAWDIEKAEALFQGKKAPAPLTPNDRMGSWVRDNMTFIETAVGRPPAALCTNPRGY